MNSAHGDNPAFEQLRDLEIRARRATATFTDAPEADRTWNGIGFRLGEHRLVIAMADVREVLHYPQVSRVPGTSPWVRGLTSLRGTLLPVVDPAALLGAAAASIGRDTRLLVVSENDLVIGLVVDEVFGLQQFASASRGPAPAGPAWLESCLAGSFARDDGNWSVLDVAALTRLPALAHAAA